MKTTENEEAPASAPEQAQDGSSRRLLKLLLWTLVIGAIALLVLLLWLLWPRAASPEQAEGYPIEVVTTIYGYGDAPEELIRTPLGVTFDGSGHVFVSNTGQSRVEQYTVDGGFVRAIGAGTEEGGLVSPYGLDVDPATGRLYVADFGSGYVRIFTTSGEYVGQFPTEEQNVKVFGDGFSPYDVEVVNGRVVVASNDGLYFFDQNGELVDRWVATEDGRNVRGPAFGQFNFPDSFTVDPDTGVFYVADTMNRRIVALSRDGQWLWVSGTADSAGQITGFWQLPRSIQFGPDGNIYVVDTFRPDPEGMGTGHIVVLSRNGGLISEFGRAGSADGDFSYPDQIAFDGNELWAMADRENHRIVIFRLHAPYPPPDAETELPRYEGMVSNVFDTWSSWSKANTNPSPEPDAD